MRGTFPEASVLFIFLFAEFYHAGCHQHLLPAVWCASEVVKDFKRGFRADRISVEAVVNNRDTACAGTKLQAMRYRFHLRHGIANFFEFHAARQCDARRGEDIRDVMPAEQSCSYLYLTGSL